MYTYWIKIREKNGNGDYSKATTFLASCEIVNSAIIYHRHLNIYTGKKVSWTILRKKTVFFPKLWENENSYCQNGKIKISFYHIFVKKQICSQNVPMCFPSVEPELIMRDSLQCTNKSMSWHGRFMRDYVHYKNLKFW